MTLESFMDRLDGVHGHMALCPAHADRNPSLSVHPGDQGILIHCFAGCSPDDICRALDITPRDLFYDSDDRPVGVRHTSRKARPKTWRKFAAELEDTALDHFLRGEAILKGERGVCIDQWSDDELENHLEAVTGARVDLALSEIYSDLAFNLRSGGLRQEAEDEGG